MTKPSGWKHSPEAKAKIAERNRARWADPAERARVSEETKIRMADPAVRQRIRDGMARAAGVADALQPLRDAWRSAAPDVRKRFLEELFAPACGESSE
ncbi:hypothetical protein Nwi_3118 [Nitrobacter winogradskyi Nb-255]|uniref:Uncharacterized protein n=2 Tax=Nitrobacter winogradskyi TaxID=913 RepID=Q3SMX6_NITWN|nr:hypothetical protein Nwi_3118 [Nitrobacter winogradskyi Nb-255]